MPAPNLLDVLSPKNIIVFMLIFTRLSGMITAAPFFSTIKAPNQVKIWFCAAIAFILYPILAAKANFIIPNSMPEFAVLLTIEFAIGFLIGFVANLLFIGVSILGEIIGVQMGMSMAAALDPVTGVSSMAISSFYTYLATLVFISTGAYEYLFAAVYKSFFALPVGLTSGFEPSIVEGVLRLSSRMFIIAFSLAMPIFSVLLVTDILLGLMSKVMPQMNIFMVSLPFKIFLGFILMIVFLQGSILYLVDEIGNFMQGIISLFT